MLSTKILIVGICLLAVAAADEDECDALEKTCEQDSKCKEIMTSQKPCPKDENQLLCSSQVISNLMASDNQNLKAYMDCTI